MRRIQDVRLVLCAFAMAVLASGCGGDKATAPPIPTVSGTWKGNLVSGTTGASVTVTLVQSDQQVTGNGAFTVGTTDVAFAGTGTFVHPNLTVTFSSSGYEPFTYTATMSDASHVSGTLSGSGFSGESLALAKQ